MAAALNTTTNNTRSLHTTTAVAITNNTTNNTTTNNNTTNNTANNTTSNNHNNSTSSTNTPTSTNNNNNNTKALPPPPAAPVVPKTPCLRYARDFRTFPAELLHRFQARPAAPGMQDVTVPFLEDWKPEIRADLEDYLRVPSSSRRSGIWHAFSVTSVDHPTAGGRGVCNFCGATVNVTYGTSVMRSHLFACKNAKGKHLWRTVCDTEKTGKLQRPPLLVGQRRKRTIIQAPVPHTPEPLQVQRQPETSALFRMRELESIRPYISEAQFRAKQQDILDSI